MGAAPGASVPGPAGSGGRMTATDAATSGDEPSTPWALVAPHSHLSMGASLDPAAGSGPIDVGPGTVLLADGSRAGAELRFDAERLALCLEPYTTAAGTQIPRRTWLVEVLEEPDGVRLKVRGRLGVRRLR